MMKFVVLSVITAAFVIGSVWGEATFAAGREGKFMRFNGVPDMGKLNLDRILSQWNKSNVAEVNRPISVYSSEEAEVTTPQPELTAEVKHVNETSKDLYGMLVERSKGFKKCVFGQKKRILENPTERKNIIFKCFKVEVIKGLRGLMTESNSISLLNGYIVLESADKPANKANRIVIKDTEYKKYTEYYQNVVDELFTSDNESSREFKDGQIFSGYGRALIHEIADNIKEEESEIRSLKDSFSDSDLLTTLGELSRKFVLRLNLFRGISAIMKRSQSTGVTFDLELDDLTGFGYDDDDDDDEKKPKKKKGAVKGAKDDESSEEYEDDDDEEEDEEEEGDGEDEEDDGDDNRDAIIDQDDEDEEEESGKGKGKGKGGKDKGKMKKKVEKIKKIIPYLLIPMLVQAAMLPLAFKFLLAFAIKALIAGKIALLLVTISLIKNANFKSDEDEYIERVGQEHYGYGKGEEYGAWVNNRRALDVAEETDPTTDNNPYRGYVPMELTK